VNAICGEMGSVSRSGKQGNQIDHNPSANRINKFATLFYPLTGLLPKEGQGRAPALFFERSTDTDTCQYFLKKVKRKKPNNELVKIIRMMNPGLREPH
jgi:hypothetical protein